VSVDEHELRVLTTLRYARRMGVSFELLERCVVRVREEESARAVDERMRQHRASVDEVRARQDAVSSE